MKSTETRLQALEQKLGSLSEFEVSHIYLVGMRPDLTKTKPVLFWTNPNYGQKPLETRAP